MGKEDLSKLFGRLWGIKEQQKYKPLMQMWFLNVLDLIRSQRQSEGMLPPVHHSSNVYSSCDWAGLRWEPETQSRGSTRRAKTQAFEPSAVSQGLHRQQSGVREHSQYLNPGPVLWDGGLLTTRLHACPTCIT